MYNYHVTLCMRQIFSFKAMQPGATPFKHLYHYHQSANNRPPVSPLARAHAKKRPARNITMELGSDKTFSLSVAMNMQPAFQDARLSFIKAPLPFANTAREQNIGRLTKHAAPRASRIEKMIIAV
jgi:hypothetical protein